MIRRIGIILLLAFEAVWLNAILPGHTRGAVVLPGSSPSGDACCAAPRSAGDSGEKPDPCDEKVKRCAVCFFAARLTTPPAIDLRLPPLARVGGQPVPAPVAVVTIDRTRVLHDRGPPSGA